MAIMTRPKGLNQRLGLSLYVSLTAVLFLFVVSGIISYLNTRTLNEDAQLITHTHEVLSALDEVLSLAKDAETGQRGYLITGNEKYLEPHTEAVSRIDDQMKKILYLTRDNSSQQARIPALKSYIDIKLSELSETIALRRDSGFEAARTVVVSDRGKSAMDSIRSLISLMQQEELRLRSLRIAEMSNAFRVAVTSGILTGIVGILLSVAVAYLLRRAILNRQLQEWLQGGQIGLTQAIVGEQRIEKLGDTILGFLAHYLNAHAGALFVKEGDRFRRVATYGVPSSGGVPEHFALSEGLLGQAAKDARTFSLDDVPEGYLSLGSAFGKGKPRHLIIMPVKVDATVNAVYELGFMHTVPESVIELLNQASESIGTAVRSAHYRSHLQNLLEETQRQTEELQAQGEELRVSNEELEEQSRALRESQKRLEAQQSELEQTNVQLEEQAQRLEIQRDDVTRAKTDLQTKAQELEQASRYKSDFLANMSHELRTPLNSSLILAKLLADNRDQNLTAEQVKYAETIQAAGNDLLTLINDILDLSKIEAGHMDVRTEAVDLSALLSDLQRMFQPFVQQKKKITLSMELSNDCPDTLVTDRQRLEQILKNLLSNALKFTESGEVRLLVSRTGEDSLAFAVRDSGIGIPEHQQQMIFEAFRQADGTTNRKYGGTGLGLSIGRELTRLLGGTIELTSTVDQGSTFTVTLPLVYDASRVREHQLPQLETRSEWSEKVAPQNSKERGDRKTSIQRAPRVADDRETLSVNHRVILVIEDDESFAHIVYNLAHELNFKCLVATTAEEGLAVAAQHRPNAIILDVGLPDNSGLTVLDRLKQDSRTRHIPVHVVSAHDHSQMALALGAVGYMLKPVKRVDLQSALEKLETKLEQRLRRILIVEDDLVQLESLKTFLGVHGVETIGAGSASECLDQLKNGTFDCMVLDLSLPDASGYSLLETLSQEDTYSFPPVIVYTGRELSVEQEERLRRYSKSIIIKGAKSPERLLDEVTLFLHQMVSELPPEQQQMIEKARGRDEMLEGRRILIVEDDVRNIFALTSILEPRGAKVVIARNGFEALSILDNAFEDSDHKIDLVLMDVMMPEMDGITATREIRKREKWRKLPIIVLTAKAMKDDQEQCLSAGATDYMAKPIDVEKLLSLVRVWMPR